MGTTVTCHSSTSTSTSITASPIRCLEHRLDRGLDYQDRNMYLQCHRCLDHSDLLLHQDTDIMDPLLRDTMALHLLRVLRMDLLLVLNMDLHLLRVLNMDHLPHSTPRKSSTLHHPLIILHHRRNPIHRNLLIHPNLSRRRKSSRDLLTYTKYIFTYN